MAKALGVDIVGGKLFAAWVEEGGPRPEPSATLSVDLPCELIPENVEKLGHWLRDQLTQAGIKASRVVCSLGRGYVTLKAIQAPVCPDGELPAIVAFALEGEWNHTGAQGGSVIDFQAGPVRGDEREVLVAMAPESLIDTVREMCESAGVPCGRIGLRPYATHFAWRHTTDRVEKGAALLVVPGADSLELAVWEEERLRLCRQVPIDTAEPRNDRAVAEVRRTIVSYQSQASDAELATVVVFGHGSSELADALRESVGHPVSLFDPTSLAPAGDGSCPPWIAASGSAQFDSSGADWPIDFLAPKKPLVVRSRHKSVAVLVGLLAFLVPASALSYVYLAVARQDARIALYEQELENLTLELKGLDETLARHQVLDEWLAGNVIWLDELADLARALPSTDDAYVTSLGVVVGARASTGKITLRGRARSQGIVTAAQTEWARDPSNHYVVAPGAIDTGTANGPFATSFDIKLDVTGLSRAEFDERTRRWAVTEPARRIPDGKERRLIGLENVRSAKKAPGKRSTVAAATAKEAPAPESSSEPSASERRADSSGESASASGQSASAEESEPKDPIARLIDELKSLPFEEREKKIKARPKFMQGLIRKRLKEAQGR